ncbi:DUF6482 family protein [Paraglaciecola aquimarina]|uniref:DUF6482 family protein n=1 Tax=Paraglaciecola algarum TaxID=3050085 RepID=A0ABS9DEJ5_9ALTE|nr:DUF6482 family protein [Paraglaciecola sp. G1-23]MCF2950438.1 DUF6482 family protein [Paraglaciecola sp. G1-23]
MAFQTQSKNFDLTPSILALADSPHYLVGAYDSNHNFKPLMNSEKIATVSSLVEAKQLLISKNINSASIEYQSAYDEMCGTQTTNHCRQVIHF